MIKKTVFIASMLLALAINGTSALAENASAEKTDSCCGVSCCCPEK